MGPGLLDIDPTVLLPPPGSHNSLRMCLEIPFQSLPSPVRFGSGRCGSSRVGTRAFKKSYQRNCASRPGRQVASATPKRFLSRLAFVRPGSDPPASENLFGDVLQPAPLRLVRTFRLGQFFDAKVTTHFAAEVCIFRALRKLCLPEMPQSRISPWGNIVSLAEFPIYWPSAIFKWILKNVCFIKVKRYISDRLLAGGGVG